MSIFYSKEKDGTMNVLVFGKVSREPELKVGQKANRVKFSVYYGQKKYMECEAWEDSDSGAMAKLLEKDDPIMCAGTYRTWEYNDKTYSSLSVDFLNTMYAPPPPSNAAPLDGENEPSKGTIDEILGDQEEGLPF